MTSLPFIVTRGSWAFFYDEDRPLQPSLIGRPKDTTWFVA